MKTKTVGRRILEEETVGKRHYQLGRNENLEYFIRVTFKKFGQWKARTVFTSLSYFETKENYIRFTCMDHPDPE